MRSHVHKYAAYMQIFENFCMCSIIFTYAISKMPIYAEKYAICGFWLNMQSGGGLFVVVTC